MKKRLAFISFLKFLFSEGQFWVLKVLIISFLGIQPVEANEDIKELTKDSLKYDLKITVDEFQRLENQNFIDPELIADIAKKITVRLEGATQGSGTLVKKEGNIYTVLTSWHFFKNYYPSDEIGIITSDGVEHFLEKESLRKVGNVDMAVLTFRSNNNYQVAKIGQIESVSEGQKIFVSGFPFETTSVTKRLFRFTKGEIISNSNKKIRDGFQLLYSNASLPGMSGGSVINQSGELIGIHGRAERQDRLSMELGKPVATGINQAVPINFYQEFQRINNLVLDKSSLKSADEYIDLAKSLNGKGYNEKIIFLANQALKFGEDFRAYEDRAFAKMGLKDYKGAVEDYKKAIKLNPNDPENTNRYYFNLAVIQKNLKDYIGAINTSNDAIKLNLGLYFKNKLYAIRALAKSRVKDYQGAVEDYTKSLEIDPFYKYYMNRGNDKWRLGDYQGALQDHNKAINLNKNDPKLYLNRAAAKEYLGELYSANEDLDKAIELLDMDIKLGQNKKVDYFFVSRANIKYKLKDFQGALIDLNKVIELNPENPKSYYNIAVINMDLGKYQVALSNLNKAIELNPNYAAAYNNLGYLKFYQIGDKKGGCKDYKKASLLGITDATWWLRTTGSWCMDLSD